MYPWKEDNALLFISTISLDLPDDCTGIIRNNRILFNLAIYEVRNIALERNEKSSSADSGIPRTGSNALDSKSA